MFFIRFVFPTDLGNFWYCSGDFWSCICESPGQREVTYHCTDNRGSWDDRPPVAQNKTIPICLTSYKHKKAVIMFLVYYPVNRQNVTRITENALVNGSTD